MDYDHSPRASSAGSPRPSASAAAPAPHLVIPDKSLRTTKHSKNKKSDKKNDKKFAKNDDKEND